MESRRSLRIMACADLHVGRALHGRSLLEDQKALLASLADMARDHHADCLLVAGDLYDRSVPGTEAIQAVDAFLTTLAGTHGIPTLVIAGNHDSPERMDFAAGLLESRGLRMEGSWKPTPRPVVIRNAEGSLEVRILPVPFVEPVHARHLLEEPSLDSHQKAWETFLAQLPPPSASEASCVHVLACHAYVAGGSESESERPLSMGASSLVTPGTFGGFHLVFAGHLHRQQHVQPHVFYPGSPLVYSASEAGQEKYVLLLELTPPEEKGPPASPSPLAWTSGGSDVWESATPEGVQCRMRRLPLVPRRRVHRLDGTFASLMENVPPGVGPGDLVYIRLSDSLPVHDAFARLQEKYPGLLHLERLRTEGDTLMPREERRRHVEAGDEDLIRGFIHEMGDPAQYPAWEPLIRTILAEMDSQESEGSH